ncbi:hypothetical protein MFIFM68171_06111 [Madurella fahalii]|uniref:Uncharacterized protein n=1 Tax=Madurella fahalii TaxID=1157608 RepID=A0ABQ0GDQ5_9PEZI
MLLRIVASLPAGLVRSVPVPERVTVSGPGVSDHGKPNLVCFPTKVVEVVIFFLINHLIHAGSVQIGPGVSGFGAFIMMAQCLLNPATGIDQDSVKDGVEKETPSTETKQPRTYRCRIARNWEIDGPRSVWWSDVTEGRVGGTDVDSTVFGGFSLPPGYRWITVPRNVAVEPLDTSPSSPSAASTSSPASASDPASAAAATTVDPGLETRQQAAVMGLSATYSVIQPLAAVVQTASAGITLYRTRGDQIDRYGFTAFGLTVVPYLIMSIINFFAHIAIPKYRALFVVQSDIFEEAVARSGHSTPPPAIVGKLPPGEHPNLGLLDVDLESDPTGPVGWRTLRHRGKPGVQSILDTETIRTVVNLEPDARDKSRTRQKDYAGEVIVSLFPSVRLLGGATGRKPRHFLLHYAQWFASILVCPVSLTVIGIISRI